MAFLRRARKFKNDKTVKKIKELVIPENFQCPITLELMKDPVTATTGITYDRESIERWLGMGNTTCPVSHLGLKNEDALIPNHSLRRMIQEWCVANESHGVERIPTPKVPLTTAQASEILSEIRMLSRRESDLLQCSQLVRKVKALAKESEKNRLCFMSSSASSAFADAFEAVAFLCESSYDGILKEILSALPIMFPLDDEASKHLGSPESLTCLATIMKFGDLAARLNAVLVVKELLANSSQYVEMVTETEGLIEALVKLIKEPISHHATSASLISVFYIINADENITSRFVDSGLIPVLLELLVEPEKSTAEKALAVFDGLLSNNGAQVRANDHALTMPILVKKMFRVSEMATQFAVSALWKLCMRCKDEENGGCMVEALQVGAFQKLLLLLQIGCNEATKAKATELLKLLNPTRGKIECIDSIDLKGIKRPF